MARPTIDSVTEPRFRPFVLGDARDSIPHRFEEQVSLWPEREALWAPAVRLTYGELNREANRLAHALLRTQGTSGEPVVLLFNQGVPSVVAILAVLKAGSFFLPLDPSHPVEHLRRLIADSGARRMIVSAEFLPLGRSLASPGVRVLCAGVDDQGLPESNPGKEVHDPSFAYVFYTSGSTGRPKGVVDTHRNVLHNVLRYTHALRIEPSDRLSLIQSPVFSGTVSSLFGALLNGATLCPFNLRKAGFSALASWIHEARISMFHSVPSILRGVAEGGRQFPTVRVVRLEGDQVLPEHLEIARRSFAPECLLAVGLGSTETGLSCQHRVRMGDSPRDGAVPIGRALDDMELSVRDEQGEPVSPGSVGEIAVRSRFLAAGYWRQPELTAAKFRPEPGDALLRTYFTGDLGRVREDGLLEFVGRRDGQAKIRGQRVEPAEVEAALLRIPGIRQAAVIIREDAPGEARLVAFIGAPWGASPESSDLRARLTSELPDVMIPSVFHVLDPFPLNEHGKMDRRALLNHPAADPPIPAVSRGEFSDDLERRVAGLWEEILGRGPVPLDADFHGLGGDSLGAARLCQRLESMLGRTVTPSVLSLHPTVRRLASWVRDGSATEGAGLVALQPLGSGAPLFFVHDLHGSVATYGALIRHLGVLRPCLALTPIADFAADGAPRSLEELAVHHLEAVLSRQSAGSIHLIGHCFGGVVVLEMVRQLERMGIRPGLVALLAVTPFDFPNLIPEPCARRHRLMNQRSGVRSQWRYLRARMEGLSWRQRMTFLAVRAEQLGPFLVRSLVSRSRGAVAVPTPPIAAYHRSLFGAHRAHAVESRVDLFLPARGTALYSSDPASDFRGLSRGGVTVHSTGGSDLTLLVDPAAQGLAAQIGSCLPRP